MMAGIRHLENRHDVIFFCRGWSDLDKISKTGAEWHVDWGDMVKLETRCRMPIWRTFGRIQRHVIPEPPVTLQGAATSESNSMSSQSHVSHCRVLPLGEFTVTIPEPQCRVPSPGEIDVMIVPHSPYWQSFFTTFFVFLNAVWALTSGGFRIVSTTLVWTVFARVMWTELFSDKVTGNHYLMGRFCVLLTKVCTLCEREITQKCSRAQ